MPKIKYQFSIKSKDELKELSHEELLKYIENLQDNLVQEKPPKNSNNSGISPSSEIIPPKKKNKSLREKSDKSVGGQVGREGVTLIRSETLDEIVSLEYNLDNCKKCSFDLSATLAKLKEKRQVLGIELSSSESKIMQFQSYSKSCLKCGYERYDDSGFNVALNIGYGSTIMVVVSCLGVFRYMSIVRVVGLMENLFINISGGSIRGLLAKGSRLS